MLREPRRSTRSSSPRFYITRARGEHLTCWRIRGWTFAFSAATLPILLGLSGLGVQALLHRDDDNVQAMRARQEEMQAAYEDRVAAIRSQMEIAQTAHAKSEADLQAQIRALSTRQAMLNTRTDALGRLASTFSGAHFENSTNVSVATRSARTKSPTALEAIDALAPGPGAPTLPDQAQALAPQAQSPLIAAKPRPDGIEIRSDIDQGPSTSAVASNASIGMQLAALNADVGRVQSSQLSSFATIATAAARSAATVRAALAETGLSLDRLKGRSSSRNAADQPMGGPYIPVKFDADGSPVETQFEKLQDQIAENERLAQALPYLPLRKPLAGELETTSPFGVRMDPFLGRMSMHPGNDFRGAFGASIMATGAGKVTVARYDGGYGNMVEIDHGDGLVTRYGHLSEILVQPGQEVRAGTIVGRLGSTGRSTGPHLHYEVRIDGQPVDPIRFVQVGERLLAER